MNHDALVKPLLLAALLLKEQLKEPVALFWMVISPVATFYLISYARAPTGHSMSYVSATSWFYAFVACGVAFFGFAFYIVGRRESGFLRSFVYTRRTKVVFLFGQYFAYSVMSVIYCCVFYCLTRPYFGLMAFAELIDIVVRFYICFLLFSIISLLLTLFPMGFQNTNTVFSVCSFLMLALGVASVSSSHRFFEVAKFYNPMGWANQIMEVGVTDSIGVVSFVLLAFCIAFGVVFKFLLINPVWSRY